MVNFAKAIAGNSDLFTAQAFVYQSNNLNLVMLITAEGEGVFTKVRIASSGVESSFFEAEEEVPLRIEKISRFIKESLAGFTNINVLFAVWHDNVLYIENEGSHKGYLLRDENLVDLTPEKDIENNGQLISGHIQKGDKLLFLTKSLLEHVGKEEDKQTGIKSILKVSPDFFDEEVNALWRGEEAASSNAENLPDEENIDQSLPEVSEISHSKLPVAAVLINFPSEEKEEKVYSPGSFTQTNNYSPKINPFMFIKNILKKKFVFLLIPLLVIFLAGGFGFYYINQQNQDKINEANSLKIQAQEKYSQAESLKELDPQAAGTSLKQAEDLTDRALKLFPNDSEAKSLLSRIKGQTPEILKTSEVSDFPTYLTLDLLRKDFKTEKLSFSLGKILMLDPSKKTLIMVDLESKNPQVLAGEEQLGEAKYASLNGDFAFVYSEDKGIVRVDVTNQKAVVVIKPDDEWGRIQGIFRFGSNIYLLDGLKNQVWKYVPVENGYSDKQEYFKNAQKDLVNAKSLKIDGSIWLLKPGPEILRYTQGVPDNFSVAGLDKNLGEVEVYFVDDTTEYLYALDKTNSRLVTFEKDGKYVSQFAGPKFKTASDMIVDEEAKKAYLLENGKIYTADLN